MGVTDLAPLFDDRFNQNSPQAAAAILGPEEQALHFARRWANSMQSDAAHELVELPSEQQAPAWRCVITRQVCEFVGEVLKAQADSQARFVLFEEFSGLLDVV